MSFNLNRVSSLRPAVPDFTTTPPETARPPPLHQRNSTPSTLVSLDSQLRFFRTFFDVIIKAWNKLRIFFKSCLNCFGLFSKAQSVKTTNHQLSSRDAEVRRRLNLQMRRSQQQMQQEPVKSFHYLSAPSTGWDAHEERVGDFSVGVCHAQGRRDTMEDEHLSVAFDVHIGNTRYPVHLFGIFDGHGGSEASQFVRDHLWEKLEGALRRFNPNGLTESGIWQALKVTFEQLDQDFKDSYGNHPGSIAYSQGATATVAMILDNRLWTANVGDSRIVLDNCGTPFQLTEDAKPSNERYKRNIQKRGGQVVLARDGLMRVNGVLAVARAVGDHYLNGAINPRPKITVKPLSEIQPGSHLILCCDGIYDVACTRDIVAAAHANRSSPPGTLAKNIVYSAYHSGSRDNLSSLVVKVP